MSNRVKFRAGNPGDRFSYVVAVGSKITGHITCHSSDDNVEC